MIYKVNNSHEMFYKRGDYVEPLKCNQPLVVVVDPGKTNMAVVVGTVTGQIKIIFELKGKDANYKAMDTTDYCLEFIRFLKDYLKECKVVIFGQEAAITKKGLEYHHSAMVLTEIRAQLINLSVELTDNKSIQINNWTWKSNILPQGYRGIYDKGSHRFLSKLDPSFASYSHDVTDVVCMYQYLINTYTKDIIIRCHEVQEAQVPYNLVFIEKDMVPSDVKYFQYNNEFSPSQNAAYFINNCKGTGACQIDINSISMEDIYKHSLGLYSDSEVYMYVKRG